MYPLFLFIAVYTSGSIFATSSILIIALLVAFGTLDILIMTRIHRLEATPIRTETDLRDTRVRVARLSRAVLLAGVALGVTFLAAFGVLVLAG